MGNGCVSPKLSICIATFNRGNFISATLESIVPQLTPEVELLILDGASSDHTETIVGKYVSRHSGIRYFREEMNSGIDRDYDKAVTYARGGYVWLMTDDDLLKPHAVERVMASLVDTPDLVLTNAETWTADYSKILDLSFLKFSEDRHYGSDDQVRFFGDTGALTSFIGSVVMRRNLWLERERVSYYGSLFIHVGVIFQAPRLERTTVIAEPLIQIRYGNAMWTARGFEIWLFLWPKLIWSFDFPDEIKALIYPREPWRLLRKLILYRAIGGYSLNEYRKFVKGRLGAVKRFLAWAIAVTPSKIVNFLAIFLCLTMHRNRIVIYDISRSANAGLMTRLAAWTIGL
jgi:abequosyltransferase